MTFVALVRCAAFFSAFRPARGRGGLAFRYDGWRVAGVHGVGYRVVQQIFLVRKIVRIRRISWCPLGFIDHVHTTFNEKG